jgi:beta-lactamase superfamily II metal-dependent hydrolase
MDKLRIRIYNVGFGDAMLLTIPDREAAGTTVMRHILIDVGNVLQGTEGDDTVFGAVVAAILAELDGRPLDLYINTHEHMDHVQGLLSGAKQLFGDPDILRQKLQTQYVWMTASSAPDYYDTHPTARQKFTEALGQFDVVEHFVKVGMQPDSPAALALQPLLAINNPQRTKDNVAFLRSLAPAERVSYLHRGIDLTGRHPFQEVQFEVWAPEEDTTQYYGRFQPLAFGLAGAAAPGSAARQTQSIPLPGVDVTAFYNLFNRFRNAAFDNLLAIDKAANNTSIVLYLEWRGWKLLFAGDAELRSWKIMSQEQQLKPIHFLKISHHASHNGTPGDAILAEILPAPAPDERPRRAVVFTAPDVYNGIPHQPTLDRLAARCPEGIRSAREVQSGGHLDIEFAG